MSKISLHKIFIVFSRFICNGKAKSIGVDRGGTPRTRKRISLRRKALLPHALSCSVTESRRLSSAAAGVQTEMSHVSVNAWVKRFKSEEIDGLNTRSGRGRKPIMDCSDEEAVHRAIEQDRQSVSKARAAWEQASGKEASDSTFKRFLSALAQDISE